MKIIFSILFLVVGYYYGVTQNPNNPNFLNKFITKEKNKITPQTIKDLKIRLQSLKEIDKLEFYSLIMEEEEKKKLKKEHIDKITNEINFHTIDKSIYQSKQPAAVIYPQTTQQVAEICKFCYENYIVVTPAGEKTGLEGG